MLTLGCRVNQYETEFIHSQWEKAGGVECGDMDNAQYICINSCAVTSNAERESRNAIYRARRSNPEAYIIMTGCAARLFNSFRPRKNAFWAEPDAIICNKNDLLAGPKGLAENSQDFFPPGILETSRHSRPVVKAQDGCDRYCAYCIVPGSRGKPYLPKYRLSWPGAGVKLCFLASICIYMERITRLMAISGIF